MTLQPRRVYVCVDVFQVHMPDLPPVSRALIFYLDARQLRGLPPPTIEDICTQFMMSENDARKHLNNLRDRKILGFKRDKE
jgi:hypothetical protein